MRDESGERLTYNIPEVARMLDISKSVAYELAREPDFPAIRISERRVVVPIDALKAWLDAKTQK